MVAAKKAEVEEPQAQPEAPPVPVNLQAERTKSQENLRNDLAAFDAKKRDAVILQVVSLAYSQNPNADDQHMYFRALAEILKTPVDTVLIGRVALDYKNNPVDIFDHFTTPAEQAAMLQTLIYCLESEKFSPKQEVALNYQQIQKAVRADDVFRDILTFFLSRNHTAKKNEGTTVKLEDILKELVGSKAGQFEAKELLKARYSGYWKSVLDRSARQIQEMGRIKEAAHKAKSAISGVAADTVYKPYSLVTNKILDKIDKDIHFATTLNESDAYILLGVVGHAASADGNQTDTAEAQYLKDLFSRLAIKVKKEQFAASIAQPLVELLARITNPELAKAVYYETMCMMTSNLEITPEEKTMLNIVSKTFNFSTKDTLLIHARHYLDSGLRGVEDSLQAMPVMLNSAHHSLHRYQEVLSELAIVPLADIVKTGKQYLEMMETIDVPLNSSAEVRVAILSLVGNAMRLDNVFDESEKAFLQKTMKDLKLTGDEVKSFPHLMKQATVPELCQVIKKWALTQKQTNALSSVGYYILRAISADGVIDEKEDKFKALFFHELNLESTQYARMLLRVQLDLVN